MKKILTDAAAVGTPQAGAIGVLPKFPVGPSTRIPWANMLWEGGYTFETPPPMVTKEGYFKQLPATGARTLNARTAFYYGYTMDTPAMIHAGPASARSTSLGFVDSDKNPCDGGKIRATLPKDILAARVLVLHPL
jgi:hypothetical protein